MKEERWERNEHESKKGTREKKKKKMIFTVFEQFYYMYTYVTLLWKQTYINIMT